MNYFGLSGLFLGLVYFSNPFQLGWPMTGVTTWAYAETTVDISIFDSRTMPGESYLLLDDCFVPIKTNKTKDDCYIQDRIEKECGIKDAMGAKCEKK